MEGRPWTRRISSGIDSHSRLVVEWCTHRIGRGCRETQRLCICAAGANRGIQWTRTTPIQSVAARTQSTNRRGTGRLRTTTTTTAPRTTCQSTTTTQPTSSSTTTSPRPCPTHASIGSRRVVEATRLSPHGGSLCLAVALFHQSLPGHEQEQPDETTRKGIDRAKKVQH